MKKITLLLLLGCFSASAQLVVHPITRAQLRTNAAQMQGAILQTQQKALIYGDSALYGSVTGNEWSILGNAATKPNINFLGTTDVEPLVFKVDGNKSGWIDLVTPFNTSFGYEALYLQTTGKYNTSLGFNSGYAINGNGNTAIGYDALSFWNSVTTNNISSCTVIGNYAGSQNQADRITALGDSALWSNTTGINEGLGYDALGLTTTGSLNVAIGNRAEESNITGSSNTALGHYALRANIYDATTGIGDSAGYNNLGNKNTYLGYQTGIIGTTPLTNATAIGNGALVASSNTMTFGNNSVTQTQFNGALMPYYSSAYNAGTSGQVLTSQGGGVAPQWSSVSFNYSRVIYFIGTSLTQGVQGYVNSYPRTLLSSLGSKWTGVNLGVSGYTAVNVLTYAHVVFLKGNADQVFVDVGTNDVINGNKALPTERTITAILDTLTAHGYGVVLNNIPPMNGMTSAQKIVFDSLEAWEATNPVGGVTFVDIKSQLNSTINSDSIRQQYISLNASPHLSDAGYEAWGNYLYANVTLTPKFIYAASVGVQGNTARLNQPLDSSDAPVFIGVNASGIKANGGLEFSTGGGVNNTFSAGVGVNTLTKNTIGDYNNAMGWEGMYSNTTGSQNAVLGNEGMYTNTTGSFNTAMGSLSLFANTTATYNTSVGYDAGAQTTTAGSNLFMGAFAGNGNITGDSDVYLGPYADNGGVSAKFVVAVGYKAGYVNTGNSNVFVGWEAGVANTSGTGCTYIGLTAFRQSTGNNNTGIGSDVGDANTTGHDNTVGGFQGMEHNVGGNFNTEYGSQGLYDNVGGNNNVGMGYDVGLTNVTGSANVNVGFKAGYTNTNSWNVFIGDSAGYANSSGGFNTMIGGKTSLSTATLTNATAIGYNAQATASNTVMIGNGNITALQLGSGSYCITVAQSAATTGTVTVASTTQAEEFTGTTPTVTIVPPSSPQPNQTFEVTTYTSTVTPTFSGTFNYKPASITVSTPARFYWDNTNSSWIYEQVIWLIVFRKRKKEDEYAA